MAEASMVTPSVFAAGRVVLDCATLFQFTTALLLKLLPLTVKVKSEPPCSGLAGVREATTGTMPGCVDCFGVLYPPQPKAPRVRSRKRIVLMTPSIRQSFLGSSKTNANLEVSARRNFLVKVMSGCPSHAR